MHLQRFRTAQRIFIVSLINRRMFSSQVKKNGFDYDIAVIGGGSGGLACAKEAADNGAKVIILDYVDPTLHGSKWGLGGTCVNVGCIPKKLMHQAGLIKDQLKDAKSYGWNVPEGIQNDWTVLVNNVQSYIKSLNWGYRVQLQEKKINYVNATGSFVDAHTIKSVTKSGKETIFKANNIVIAIGGRPIYPQIAGTELGITSDDIFSLKRPPGKTLVVGASYVALECAGFLASLNFPVDLMIRSIPLRGFDQQMASLVVESLVHHGVKLIEQSVPLSVEKSSGSKLRVSYKSGDGGGSHTQEYDTVLWAIGREASTGRLNLNNAGVTVHESRKLAVDQSDCTNVKNIFAIGDAQLNRLELTPLAIMAGKLLARRLTTKSQELMDYDKIPTTLFTPLEYGCVGLSEESAIQKFGEEKLEVFHAFYKPLEFALSHRDDEKCYLKVICSRQQPPTVLGLHFLGPNAGEITQGFTAAMRLNMTIHDLQKTVGIHPTCAEELVKVRITKRSGESATVTGC